MLLWYTAEFLEVIFNFYSDEQIIYILNDCLIKNAKSCMQNKGNYRINDASAAPSRGLYEHPLWLENTILQKGDLLFDRCSFPSLSFFFPTLRNLLCGCTICLLNNSLTLLSRQLIIFMKSKVVFFKRLVIKW